MSSSEAGVDGYLAAMAIQSQPTTPTFNTDRNRTRSSDNKGQSSDNNEQDINPNASTADSLNQTFQDELQHVSQWFNYLTEAQRTATIAELLMYSSPLQINVFIDLLQEMKRPKPETLKTNSDRASAIKNLRIRAPPQTRNTSTMGLSHASDGSRFNNNRHSYAIGDTMDDRSALFGFMGTDWFSSPTDTMNPNDTKLDTATSVSSHSRSKSSVGHEANPSFANSWLNRRQSNIMLQQQMGNSDFLERPRSADISSWTITPAPSLLNNRTKHTSWMPFDPTSDQFDIDFGRTDSLFTTSHHPFTTAIHNASDHLNNSRRSSYVPGQQQQQYPTNIYSSSFNSNSTTKLSPSRSSSLESTSQEGFHGYSSDHSDTMPVTPGSTTASRSRPVQQQHQHTAPRPQSMYASTLNSFTQTAHHWKKPHSNPAWTAGGAMTTDIKDEYQIDMDLVRDVPAWFRSMRLHKYNPIFEKMRWQDIIQLDDEALKAKGVAALGARRKMLKVFDQVKEHCQQNNIDYSS